MCYERGVRQRGVPRVQHVPLLPSSHSDAVLVSIMDCVTSVFAGLVIFSIIGYMAHELGRPIEEVAADGPGLAFVLYPLLVTKLPLPQLWLVGSFE